MKWFTIGVVLCLLGFWSYTSWYWYVCKIKGFCDVSYIQIEKRFQEKVISWYTETLRENIKEEELQENQWDDILLSQSESMENISIELPNDVVQRKDTLFITEKNKTKKAEKEQREAETLVQDIQEDHVPAIEKCPIITWPIWFGEINAVEEVKLVESILLEEGFQLVSDGVYGQDDFEAVKSFQLKYRSDILDPWNITEPTGYVYRTTVKKMNAILCN